MDDSQIPCHVNYWLTEAEHDCFFVLGCDGSPEERIGAIRVFLMGYSKPLRAMLGNGGMAEKGDIRVNDVEPDTFRNFLKCIYGASHLVIPELTFEEKAKLLYVYEKYLVDDLKDELIEDMEESFSFVNMFVALSHPVCRVTPSLKRKMYSIVKFNLERLVSDDRFLEVNKSGIKWILQLDYIPVEEIELWHAVLKWAKFKSDSVEGNVLRQYIFDLLKHIRFLTMKHNEFWDGVVSTEILNKEEISAICQSFVSSKPHDIDYLSTIMENRYDRYPVSECTKGWRNEHPQYLSTPHSAQLYFSVSLTNLEQKQGKLQYSQSYPWAGHFWYLYVAKREVEQNDYLQVFIGCQGKTEEFNCSVHVKIRLINQYGKSDETYNFTTIFSMTNSSRGYRKFYNWEALLNEDKGFVNDGSVVIAVEIGLDKSD
ncbi:uncharacterized protein LOC128986543 [Macrosteles quadrilineatus]|uniref:uncharacterized protein LOC128986543 n=1 Tax=Macrosteles quadrilineatus TaxID=74068 RepID=UPI0023E26EA3|nr:uncharacterized protein LOC128986543 [Macrosteles quadrilineatus]XP_054262933.1 uncharacterized protein LOC128986543 [Macrosteles quadrilineatus]XP_054262934.1 uncharacterized protein LOC128986543 [Macrosteles quadrilineatus]XP_054262935.1 uncharacterized protein LOC128986543 [Macrosteles quadrilineatus]XP_054262936.1 uncharacterized protein LOC128986543 [Macrosteles quadrilineatus]XP_054262937.1 uncharacterized protein LOC128986543 [Macrosteles quadrilineatus]XP_054262938.1 uncharacterize